MIRIFDKRFQYNRGFQRELLLRALNAIGAFNKGVQGVLLIRAFNETPFSFCIAIL